MSDKCDIFTLCVDCCNGTVREIYEKTKNRWQNKNSEKKNKNNISCGTVAERYS